MVMAANVALGSLWSLALDNFPPLKGWFDPLENWQKRLFYFGSTLVLGFGLYAAGLYGLSCEGWAGWADVIPIVLSAALAWFAGSYRHERSKE